MHPSHENVWALSANVVCESGLMWILELGVILRIYLYITEALNLDIKLEVINTIISECGYQIRSNEYSSIR